MTRALHRQFAGEAQLSERDRSRGAGRDRPPCGGTTLASRWRPYLVGVLFALLAACSASTDEANDSIGQAGSQSAAGAAPQTGVGGVAPMQVGTSGRSGAVTGSGLAGAGAFAGAGTAAAGAGGTTSSAGVSGSAAAGTGGAAAVAGSPAAGSGGSGVPSAGAGGTGAAAGAAAGTGGNGPAAGSGGTGPLPRTTVWVAGDSTVMTYPAADAPQEGWGQELGMFMAPEATINNQALGGRSTRTFMYGNVTCENGAVRYTGGTPNVMGTRWERIVTNIKPGDYCLIQFGHNDGGTVCERHVDLPEFKRNLNAMAIAIRERMATPIFITPMSQLSYSNGMFKATLTNYAAAMKEQAMADGVALFDLNTASIEFYRSAGYAKVSSEIFLPGESTHFQKQGAIELARLVSQGLAAEGGDLARYVKR